MAAPIRGTEVGRYKVFINKPDKHLLVLRFPDRGARDLLASSAGLKPLALRIKPKSRLVELDIPLPDKNHIDKRRAIELGQGLLRHIHETKNAPVGIAGGFGNAPPVRAPANGFEQASTETLMRNFDAAMEDGRALNRLTFSGLVKPFAETDATHYVGSFKSDELHLTKVAAFCTLAPGLQHLDAIDVGDKMARRAAREDEDDSKEALVGMQAKAGEERMTDESVWKSLLGAVHAEKWQDLEWVDCDDQDSWDAFNDTMFLDDGHKENRIMAVMSKKQYLDASFPPRIDPVRQGRRIKSDGTLAEDGETDFDSASDEEVEDQVMTDVRG